MTEEVKTAAVVTEAAAAESKPVPQELLDFACMLADFPQVNGTVSARDISGNMVGSLDAQRNITVTNGTATYSKKEPPCR